MMCDDNKPIIFKIDHVLKWSWVGSYGGAWCNLIICSFLNVAGDSSYSIQIQSVYINPSPPKRGSSFTISSTVTLSIKLIANCFKHAWWQENLIGGAVRLSTTPPPTCLLKETIRQNMHVKLSLQLSALSYNTVLHETPTKRTLYISYSALFCHRWRNKFRCCEDHHQVQKVLSSCQQNSEDLQSGRVPRDQLSHICWDTEALHDSEFSKLCSISESTWINSQTRGSL